ncbi:MAG TPA: mechanosensitive ion channel [Deltaproteobacteria bacterium]|nr:mechanosensitive ion channel [Deltaproteobacteria bacterium]
MTPGGLHLNVWLFVKLLGLALCLLLLVRGLRILLQIAPMSNARRRSLEQAFPMAELIVSILYLVAGVQLLFEGDPWLASIAVLGILFGGLWLARIALMDLLTGVFLRTNGSLVRGDWICVEGLEGQVSWLGTRALSVRTSSGDVVLIPYSRLAGQPMVRTTRSDGAHRHTFRLEGLPSGQDEPAAERIRHLAWLCHWSSAAQPPSVRRGPDDAYEVTVFALEPDRGLQIEAFVRKHLKR